MPRAPALKLSHIILRREGGVSWPPAARNNKCTGSGHRSFKLAGEGEILAPLLSINSLMRPRTEPDNAQNQHREDSNIKQCINHVSLHSKQIAF